MKRILAVLLAIMLFVAVMPMTSFAEGAVSNSSDKKVYHVATQHDDLRLRAEPNDHSAIKARLPKGTALIYQSKANKNWYKVKTPNGLEGYVFKKYLGDYGKADVATKKDPLHVRKTPGKGKVLTSIPHGTKGVTIYAINGNWAKVKWNGYSGYSSMSYLRWTRW